mgnify:CR=1 FL=1
MNPDALSSAIARAVGDILATRGSDAGDIDAATVALERPKNRDHGDWATSIALKLAKNVGMNPRELATELQSALAAIDGIRSVDIAGPGFLNITLAPASWHDLVPEDPDAVLIGYAVLDYARSGWLPMAEVIAGGIAIVVVFTWIIRRPAQVAVADFDEPVSDSARAEK